MYIWIGVNVENQLLKIKEKAQKIENELVFENSNFTLPLHVSLKISFEVKDEIYKDVVKIITDYYKTLTAFPVEVKGIEKHTVIVWIRMKKNDKLNKIHDDLNELLSEKYGVGLHEYDLDYKFHTTLFSGNDVDKNAKAYELVKDCQIPSKLLLDTFVVGISKTGELGTFSVYETVKLPE